MFWSKKSPVIYISFLMLTLFLPINSTEAKKKIEIKKTEKILSTEPNLKDILVIKKN